METTQSPPSSSAPFNDVVADKMDGDGTANGREMANGGTPTSTNNGIVENANGGENETNKVDEDQAEEEEEEQVKHVRELVRRKRRRARARLSGPAWEAGVKGAADWNANVLRDRYLRGPWYWDPNSRSPQLFREWNLAGTPAMLQLDALAKYLLPLTPEQQSALLAAYTAAAAAGPTTPLSANPTTLPLPIQPTSSALSSDASSGRKQRGKRARPKGPHCRMCLKEESAEGALIRCTECKDQYHPDCLELKKENIPKMMSFGWRCMHCKKCETCKDTGDEEKLLFCDACDRGFHTFCLSPPLKRPPIGGWFCRECVECKSCGGKTAGKAKSCRWHRGYTMCEMCYKRYKHNKYCPVCTLVYQDRDARNPALLRSCVSCRHCVHAGCDGNFAGVTSPYQCPPCRKKGAKLPTRTESEDEEDEEEEEESRNKSRNKSKKRKGHKKKGKKEEEEDEEDEEDEDEEEEEEDRKNKSGRSPVDGKRKRKSRGGEKEERAVSPGRGERRSKRTRAGEP